MQPTVGIDRSRRRFLHFKVAEHDVVATRAELANLADRGRLSRVRINDLGLHVRQRQTDGPRFVLNGVGGHRHGRHWRAFGLAEHDRKGRPELLLEQGNERRRHGGPARADRLDRRKIDGRE